MSDTAREISSEIRREALSAAARWYAEQGVGDTAGREADWRRWHDANPANQWAWQRIEALRQQLQSVPGPLSAMALAGGTGPDRRRRALLMTAGLAVTAGWFGMAELPWQGITADHRTAVGERRHLQLADGSRLVLDTDTAVSVHYDGALRRIHLHRGEVMLTSAPDPMSPYRPLVVDTADGRVQALGTRFGVRQRLGATRVVVFEDKVEIRPAQVTTPLQLVAGQQLQFGRDHTGAMMPADERLGAWVDGRLVIDDWRLDALVAELSRYRTGWLRCDPAAAALRISGAFPLDDINAALAAIERALPVTASGRGDWWVTLTLNDNNS